MADIPRKSLHTLNLEVTGRDRAQFFKRPVLPNVAPLPCVHYAIEIAQTTKEVEQTRKIATTKPPQVLDPPNIIVSTTTQTEFRDSEAQTEPCSLASAKKLLDTSALGALEPLKIGHGLPVTSPLEIEVARGLYEQQQKMKEILDPTDVSEHKKSQSRPPVTTHTLLNDLKRSASLRKVLENRYKSEFRLQQSYSTKARAMRLESMRNALESFTVESDLISKQRLDWLCYLQEKRRQEEAYKMEAMFRKERLALEHKNRVKQERLFKKKEVSLMQFLEVSKPPKRKKKGQVTFDSTLHTDQDENRQENEGYRDFKTKMAELSSLEQKLSDDLERYLVSELPKKEEDGVGEYVPRRKQYAKLLDKVYDDIKAKKTPERSKSAAGHFGFESNQSSVSFLQRFKRDKEEGNNAENLALDDEKREKSISTPLDDAVVLLDDLKGIESSENDSDDTLVLVLASEEEEADEEMLNVKVKELTRKELKRYLDQLVTKTIRNAVAEIDLDDDIREESAKSKLYISVPAGE